MEEEKKRMEVTDEVMEADAQFDYDSELDTYDDNPDPKAALAGGQGQDTLDKGESETEVVE